MHKVIEISPSLNPYCSGRKNRIQSFINKQSAVLDGLNPYCSGRKNRIGSRRVPRPTRSVLILIVVEERIG